LVGEFEGSGGEAEKQTQEPGCESKGPDLEA